MPKKKAEPQRDAGQDKPAPAQKPKSIAERLDAVIAGGDAHVAELAAIIKETLGK